MAMLDAAELALCLAESSHWDRAVAARPPSPKEPARSPAAHQKHERFSWYARPMEAAGRYGTGRATPAHEIRAPTPANCLTTCEASPNMGTLHLFVEARTSGECVVAVDDPS